MSKEFMIETPSGRYGKKGVIIPMESILENLGSSEAQLTFKENFQVIANYGKDDTFELRLIPSQDKRHKRMIVAKVYVTEKNQLAYLALHKRQEHYALDPQKTYVCRRNHLFPLTPIENIEVYTIEIIAEKKPEIPEGCPEKQIAPENVYLETERKNQITVLKFSTEETACISREILGEGWYIYGKELRRIYTHIPDKEETAKEDLLIKTLPEKIRCMMEKRLRSEKEKAATGVTQPVKPKKRNRSKKK